MARRGKKVKPWPLVVAVGPDGRSVMRWYGSKVDALAAMRAGGDDDTMYVEVGGQRIEVSFHASPAAARRARDRDVAAGLFAAMPVEGHA